MLEKVTKRLRTEIEHYQALAKDVRRLLVSYYLYLVAYPLFAVFTNAYLWRQGEDILLLIIYNLCYCFGLPLGFYLNGLLLRYMHALKLYAVGGIVEAMAAVLIVVFPSGQTSFLAVYGLVAGLGAGVYWANKNYLSLRLTRKTNRLYYNTLESAGDMIINMIIPALTGSFIVLGEQYGWYLPATAYKLLMFFALIVVTVAGLVVQTSHISDVNHEAMVVTKHSPSWTLVRLHNILANVVVGAEFVIPSVLVLVLVGKEGTLGLISSGTAILTASSLYILGRVGKANNGWKIARVGGVIYLIGAMLLAIFYNPITVLIYMAVSTVGWAFRWSPSYTVVMEAMDREDCTNDQYAYVCDNELTFNIGRSLGLGIIFVALAISQTTALRFVPLIVGLTSLLALIPLAQLSHRLFGTKA